MNCKNCGMSLPDGAQFCAACGAVQEAEAPAEVATPVENPVEAPADFVAPDFTEEAPKKKKRKLKYFILPAVALISAAAVLLCVFNWGWITKKWLDLFGKDEDLRNKVIAEETEMLANSLSKQYGNSIRNMKAVLSGDKYASTTIELVVGDTAEELLVDAVGSEAEDAVRMLNGSYCTIAGGNSDNMFQAAIKAGIGGEELLSVGAIMDFVNEELYVSVPNLSEYHLDMSEEFSYILEDLRSSIDAEEIEAMAAAIELLDAMPSEETVNALLQKYIAIAVAEFDDVSKDKETLSIGGIKEKVTILETSISEANVQDAVVAMLEEVTKDDEIEKIIKNFVDTVNGIQDTGYSADEVYEELMAELEYVIEDLDSYDADPEEVGLITQYLNSAYETIGLAVEADGEEVLYYATATKGNNFAFEMEVDGEEIMSGEGTNKKGIVNGTFNVEVMGQDVMTIKVSNFDKNAYEQGNFKGSFEISPSDDLMEEVLDNTDLPSAIAMLDLGLKLDINKTADSSSLQVSITDDGDVLVGVKLSTTISDKKVTAPSADKTAYDVMQWVSTFDYDALLESLSNLGVPSDLLDELEDALYELEDELYYYA